MTGEPKVYVVDQDLSARQGLVLLLAKAGLDVAGRDSMEAYLASFDAVPQGCLVVDSSTLGSTPARSLESIRVRNGLTAVLVISVDDDSESRRRARSVKAEAFFRKPVDGTALLDAIRWALR